MNTAVINSLCPMADSLLSLVQYFPAISLPAVLHCHQPIPGRGNQSIINLKYVQIHQLYLNESILSGNFHKQLVSVKKERVCVCTRMEWRGRGREKWGEGNGERGMGSGEWGRKRRGGRGGEGGEGNGEEEEGERA